jgi:hypothetical protein
MDSQGIDRVPPALDELGTAHGVGLFLPGRGIVDEDLDRKKAPMAAQSRSSKATKTRQRTSRPATGYQPLPLVASLS